jgi:hypothetical protein
MTTAQKAARIGEEYEIHLVRQSWRLTIAAQSVEVGFLPLDRYMAVGSISYSL